MTKILTTRAVQDYAEAFLAIIRGHANAGDGAGSTATASADMVTYAEDSAQVDRQIKQAITLIGQIAGKSLTVGQIASGGAAGTATTITINNAGTGYTPGTQDLALTTVNGTGVIVNVTIEAGGTVDTVNSITAAGTGLLGNETDAASTDGVGTGVDATFDVEVTAAGSGYAVGDKFTVDSTEGAGGHFIVTSVDETGTITGSVIGGAGAGYELTDTDTTLVPVVAGNVGTGATVTAVIATNEVKLLTDLQDAFA